MNDDLLILWTNDNPVTADKMVFLYAHNAKKRGWFDTVTLLIWGATAQLAAEDEAVRARLREMQRDGVHLSACKACADQLGVSDSLAEIGVELKYWGEPLTEALKSGQRILTI